MTEPAMPEPLSGSTKRAAFFKMVFGTQASGYICITYIKVVGEKKTVREEFYHYPNEFNAMMASIETNYQKVNAYFCPQLLATRERPPGAKSARVKENVKTCTCAWADLDTCDPDLLLVEPSMTIMSSGNRFQALWVFDTEITPAEAEQVSKNIAYHHVPDGADSGGWDLTQLLRIPYTYNFKYNPPAEVKILRSNRMLYTLKDFTDYKESRINRVQHDPMPEILPTEPALDLIQRYRKSVNPLVFSLFDVTPPEGEDGGWSKPLWQLQMLCFEAGMSREEVFVIASEAACNKYKRDGKHPRLLWEEVCRAYEATIEKLNILVPETEKQAPLISEAELESVANYTTFVERYIAWATSLGDAAVPYHQAAAFMILSSLLAGSIRLPTSFGNIMPNLWFMILGDTTLTRKSTAMGVATRIIDEVNEDILLATDGSVEGLMQSLEIRPGKPSLFLRDEVAGLIEAMLHKDYMAGMAEAFTKLYDGETMKRVLRRETITVRDPCLLFFAGGIKTRVQSLLTLDHIASGFVPRFIFVTAESDVARLQPLGPPTDSNLEERAHLVDELQELYEHYVRTQEITLKGKVIDISNAHWEAQLTQEAWLRYNQLEATLLYAGVNADQPDIMTPVYDRLSKSILKAAVLIAATRQREDTLVVELRDLLLAIKYGEGWRDFANEVINGIGRTANEVLMQRILKTIRRHPSSPRSRLMQWYHLEARQADIIFNTLEQRGLIVATRMGRTWIYEAVGRMKA